MSSAWTPTKTCPRGNEDLCYYSCKGGGYVLHQGRGWNPDGSWAGPLPEAQRREPICVPSCPSTHEPAVHIVGGPSCVPRDPRWFSVGQADLPAQQRRATVGFAVLGLLGIGLISGMLYFADKGY